MMNIPLDIRQFLEAEIQSHKARMQDEINSLDLLETRVKSALMRVYELGVNKGRAEGYAAAVEQHERQAED